MKEIDKLIKWFEDSLFNVEFGEVQLTVRVQNGEVSDFTQSIRKKYKLQKKIKNID